MRRIGPADVEFYHAAMVQIVARSLGGRDYDSLGYKARQRRLDRAVALVGALVNDEQVLSTMFIRYRSLASEGALDLARA